MTNTKTFKGRCSKLKKLDRRMRSLLSDKRAISVTLSTLILTAGVIAAGITILYWAYSWGSVADQQYSNSVGASQNAMTEMIGYEYSAYSSGQLTVYMINSGKTNNLTIASAYIWDSNHNLVFNSTNLQGQLKFLNGTTATWGLNVGSEGYLSINPSLALNSYYSLRLVTQRGRNFDTAFAT